MAATDRKIRATLARSVEEHDEKALLAAQELIDSLEESRSLSSEAAVEALTAELLVLCAESAVQVGRFDIAAQCVDKFFVRSPPANSMLCRAYFAKALIEGEVAKTLKGDESADQSLKAISYVMKGLDLALTDPRYHFLVFNASLHHWQLGRPLNHHSRRAKLLPTMVRMARALEDIGDPAYDWRIRYAIFLASCYEEARQFDDLFKTLAAAYQLASKHVPGMKHEVFRVQVHMARHKPEHLNRLRSEASGSEMRAVFLLQSVKSGISGSQQIEKDLTEAFRLVEKGDDDLQAEIGRVALAEGLAKLAEDAASRTTGSKSLRSRVMSEMVSCELALLELGGRDSSHRFTKHMVHTRIELVKRLEKSLSSALRLNDPPLVQDICILIWNVSLPLLQPNLRKYVKRPLQKATKALEEVDSQLNRFRVQLHLELAKCEVGDDLLAKAKAEADKALNLDYTISEDEFAVLGLERPLDRHLTPLKTRLELRTRLYAQPESPEEQAVLLVEQAKDAREINLKATLLERAVHIMQSSNVTLQLMDVEPSASQLGPPQQAWLLRERAVLWADIIKTSWQSKLVQLAQKCMPYFLPVEWDPSKDKDIVRLQSQVHFIQAEAVVAQLTAGTGDLDDLDEDVTEEDLAAGLNSCAQELLRGMRLGALIGEDFLVTNGAVYIWNYFIPIYRAGRQVELVAVLDACFDILAKTTEQYPLAFCKIATALIHGLHQLGAMQSSGPGSKQQLGASLILGADRPTTAGNEFKRAEEVFRTAAPLLEPMQKQDLVEAMAFFSRVRGSLLTANAALKLEPESQVMVYLEYLAARNDSDSMSRRREALVKAVDLLQAFPQNVQLWARLAKEALALREYSVATSCSNRALDNVPPLPAANEVVRDSAAKRWRFFSLCEMVVGQSLMATLDPDRQEKGYQDRLRLQAVSHFALAASYGGLSFREGLVIAAARHFWNAATSFMHSAVTRQILIRPLETIVDNLPRASAMSDESDVEFQVSLFKLLFDCLNDHGRWKDGMRVVNKAFTQLPQEHHKALWEARIAFVSKVGRDVAGDMFKVKEYDVRTQARVWATVARSSSSKFEQLSAYHSAIAILDDYPVNCAEYMIEYGEWLYCNDFPIEDAEDQLQAAADILLDIEHAPDLEEADHGSEYGGTSDGGRSRLATARRTGAATAKSARSELGHSVVASTAGSVQGGNETSRRKIGNAATSARALSVLGTQAGDGQSVTRLNVQHLEMLSRIYVMLARMSPNFQERVEYCFLAHYYFMRMWSMSVETAWEVELIHASSQSAKKGSVVGNSSMAGGALHSSAAAAAAAAGSPGDPGAGGMGASPVSLPLQSLGSGGAANSQAAQAMRTQEHYQTPSELHEWAMYRPSQTLRGRFKNTQGAASWCMINRRTINKPELMFAYANYLLEHLQKYGYHLHCLPVFVVLQTIVEDVLASPALLSMVRLKFARLLETLHFSEQASLETERAGTVRLTNAVRKQYMEEVRQRNLIKKNVRKGGDLRGELPSASRYDDENNARASGGKNEKLLQPISIREIWLGQTEVLVHQGRIKVAKELLEEVQVHADTFDDHETLSRCLHLLAFIASLEGRYDAALELELEVQQFQHDIEFWTQSITALADYLVLNKRTTDAREMLAERIEVFGQIAQERPNSAVDALRNQAKLQQKLATVAMNEASVAMASEGPFHEDVSVAFKLSSRSAKTMYQAWGGPDLLENFYQYARLLLSRPCNALHTREMLCSMALRYLRLADREGTQALAAVCPPMTPESVSMPLARLLARIKLLMSMLELEMAPFAVSESKTPIPFELGDLRDFIRSPDPDTPRASGMRGEERALMYASSARNLVKGIQHLEINCTHQIGRCLQSFADREGQLDSVWGRFDVGSGILPETADATPAATAELAPRGEGEAEGQGEAEAGDDEGAVLVGDDAAAAAVDEDSELSDKGKRPDFREQAVNCMVQAMMQGRGMPEADLGTMIGVCLDLVECHGIKDPALSLQFLCQAQSLAMVRSLQEVLKDAADPRSREAQLFQLLEHLRGEMVEPMLSPVYKRVIAHLEEHSQAWQSLQVGASLPEILGALPSNVRVLTLHLSEDQTVLYGAYVGGDLGKSKISRISFDAAQFAQTKQQVQALQMRLQGLPGRRRRIKQRIGRLQESTGTERSGRSRGGARGSIAKKPRALKRRGSGSSFVSMMTGLTEDVLDDEEEPMDTSAAYDEIVAELDALLSPLLGAWEAQFAEDSGTHLVVVADMDLQRLPLESHPSLQGKGFLSVTRDFSVHMLHQRMQRATVVADKKSGQSSAALARNNFSYIVDPRHEDTTKAARTVPPMIDGFADGVLKGFPGASNWEGLSGSDLVPSTVQWQNLMRKPGQFLFYGLGRCLAYVLPRNLVGLDMSESNLVWLVDRSVNEQYYYRQMKLDNVKTETERALEGSVPTAALFSLQGARSVILNQWGTTIEANHEALMTVTKALKAGKTTGEALQAGFREDPAVSEQLSAHQRFAPILYGVPMFRLG